MSYNKTGQNPNTSQYSPVENYVLEKIDKLEPELQQMVKEKKKMDIILNSLSPKKYDLIKDRFWENKTYEGMADGTYDTFCEKTIRELIDRIVEEIYKLLK